jgi:hypothetical protein
MATIIRKGGRIYIANESFVANVDGIDKAFYAGRTRVREGDQILERCPNYFDELEDHDASQSYA